MFEQYFYKKYNGNEYDQTQLLSGFLKDDLFKVYEARGGRKVKYPKMKEQLLKYFKK